MQKLFLLTNLLAFFFGQLQISPEEHSTKFTNVGFSKIFLVIRLSILSNDAFLFKIGPVLLEKGSTPLFRQKRGVFDHVDFAWHNI